MPPESIPEDENGEEEENVTCWKKHAIKIVPIIFLAIVLIVALLVGLNVEKEEKENEAAAASEIKPDVEVEVISETKELTLKDLPLAEFLALASSIDYFPL